MTALLFVYGTLKQGGQLHHELTALGTHFMSPAKTQGELFRIKGESWPGAFPAASENYIHGELYKMTRPVETLKRLDEIEGCARGLFVRTIADVWKGNNKVKAWMYLFNHPEKKASQIMSGKFSVK